MFEDVGVLKRKIKKNWKKGKKNQKQKGTKKKQRKKKEKRKGKKEQNKSEKETKEKKWNLRRCCDNTRVGYQDKHHTAHNRKLKDKRPIPLVGEM